MKKLSLRQMLSVSLMLFAIFFGAGNMIFPPAMGHAAGSGYFAALLGFITTDAGIAILGITAVVLCGDSITDLASLVSKRFGLLLPIGVYLLIGPLFALPRTGSVSFELALTPFLGEGSNTFLYSVIFTAFFFLLTYFLSSNPTKIVDIVGKILTPVLLVAIAVIFFGCLFSDVTIEGQALGAMQEASGAYTSIPFFQGMIEGYLALDGPAGLAFSIIVIHAIRELGVENKKDIVKYTCLCGLGAAFFLSIVYFALTYVGAITPGSYANGGTLLTVVTKQLFGTPGVLLLGVAVLLACLTTSIGLTTSFADYLTSVYPKLKYKQVALVVCLFSFLIANVGLTQLITISLPILIMIYPVTVVLMVLSFFRKKIQDRRMVYVLGMVFAFAISFFSGLDNANIHLGALHDLVAQLPFYPLGIAWMLPAVVGALLGFLPCFQKANERLVNS